VSTPGKPFDEFRWLGVTYDEAREGCYNGAARLADMDRDGVGAEILFPPQRSQVLFHLGNVELVSQLIDGKFPDYSAIVPKRHETRAVMDTAPLLKACRAASVFARENSNIARVTIAPGSELAPGHVTVQATSAETGDNAGELDASVEGAPIEIAFNVKFMIEVLSVAGTPQVALETTSPSSPGMIRPIGDDEFTHVIMPMHIGGR